MFGYCGNENLTLNCVWLEHGLNPCLVETLTAGSLLLYLLVVCLPHFYTYKRHSRLTNPNLRAPSSFFYNLQFYLHLIRLSTILILLLLCINGDFVEKFSVSLLVKYLVDFCAWLAIFGLLILERKFLLPQFSRRKEGHGAVILIFYAINLCFSSLAIVSYNSDLWFWKLKNSKDIADLTIFAFNYVSTLILLILGFLGPGLPVIEDDYNRLENQNQQNSSDLKSFWHRLLILLPYLWPRRHFILQVCVIACLSILIAGRFINVYIPLFHKWIVDSLSLNDSAKLVYRWDLILVYALLLLSQGGAVSGGLLSVVRSFLWIKVQQYTTREIEVHLYAHLHSLSLRWHLSRKTGEVLRVMDRGTNSINQLLAYLLFNILPTIIDIIVAIVYFTSSFNLWFGFIVFLTMVVYLTATIMITEWRTKYRRLMNRLENDCETLAVDALLNFETVKYYNGEQYEVNRYKEALLKYQAAEWQALSSMSVLNLSQNFIITCGLLAGSLLCAWFVVDKQNYPSFTAGSYVLFATYIMQLYQPLNWLGTYYRVIQQSFVDMENMFDLLKEKQEIVDSPQATELGISSSGRIEFENVNFHYNLDRPILKNISFVVEPGKSLALVGPSGSGKSTVIRLLFRFYNVDSGRILIDGQDISSVKQTSLRQHIGVVPQDTVLFNETIKYNIRYGKVSATEREVYDAARAAEIHDKILTFGEGYDTLVGERGLKLSGGEKQRVAIARTILKAPNIVLLDEATSALDTRTERLIQSSLDEICVGRTTIIVAHRLSTIINVDEILVLKDGEIVERGNHEALLARNQIYAQMWREQLEKSVPTTMSV